MPRQFKPRKDLNLDRMFETRSEAWERVGLSVDVSQRAIKRAQREAMFLFPLAIALVIAYNNRFGILGWARHGHRPSSQQVFQTPLQIAVAIALVIIGWALARDASRFAGPTFMRRMDPATAGTFGFIIRLITIVLTVIVALRVAGAQLQTLALGGGFTAVVVGLAAQQTLGNAIAGMVLISARPFRVGERVRLQAGATGGQVEGIVSSLGLLYTTLTSGTEQIMIPNNVVIAAVVVPLREPDSIDVRVRLSSGVRPSRVQAILDNEIGTPTRSKGVLLEEVDGDDVVVRVQATPELADDGPRLADEIMTALSSVTGEHETAAASNRR
jgi:small conductance mechanosensitive channel